MTEQWEDNWKDYYKILKIDDPSVKPEIIEKAYRKLSQKYKYEAKSDQFSSRKLADVKEAYKILGKPEKRARYDLMYLQDKQKHNKDKSQKYQPKSKLFQKITPAFFKNNPKMLIIPAFIIVAALAIGLFLALNGGDAKKTYSSPPPMTIDQNKQYTATIKTNYGDIVLDLFPKEAPLTANNFVFLARDGFYDGIIFHRVVEGFMIQSGDPTGTGAGGPGYEFADELPTNLDYTKGTIAMANSGSDTNGSQFFIMLADYTNGKLPKNYSIFGKVISGQDVANNIGNVPVKTVNNENSSPTVDVHIDTVIITES